MKQKIGKQQRKIKKSKRVSFKRPAKLANLYLKERERTQITNIRSEKWDITIYRTETEKIIQANTVNNYANKVDNHDKTSNNNKNS